MVPATYSNFFVAMAGAGAALIGLLFVAVSINPRHTMGPTADAERQAVAANAFTALANAFFISAAGLLPGSFIGFTTLVLAISALFNSVYLGVRLLPAVYRRTGRWHRLVAVLLMIIISVAVYSDELFNALALLRAPHDPGPIAALAGLLLAVYGIALIRSWELLGGPHSGVFGLLNPLAGHDGEPSPPPAAAARDASPHAASYTPAPVADADAERS
ncbi:MAG: hypothetical protein ACHQ4H_03810 [Ktedonobacterales bacterium]